MAPTVETQEQVENIVIAKVSIDEEKIESTLDGFVIRNCLNSLGWSRRRQTTFDDRQRTGFQRILRN